MAEKMKYRPWPRSQIVDPLERSPDAEFILEGDEFDFVWTEEQIEPSWLRFDGGQYSPDIISEEDRDRLENITRLANACGGLESFIYKRPILAFDNGKLLDGAHRAYLAAVEGIQKVTVLVGHRPDDGD